MTFELSMWRKRLTGLILILPLMVALGVAAYKYGPSPTRSAEQVTAAPTPQPRLAESTEPANSHLLDLFGMYETAVARGRVLVTPTEYLNSVEALYRQRGYLRLGGFDQPRTKNRKPDRRARKETIATRFFQRAEGTGINSISATGEDADYNTGQKSSEPYTFSTVVVAAEGGGAEWATYRLEIDRKKLAQVAELDRGDFPGTDPANVPRLAALQRVYAMTSANGSIAIYKSQEAHTSVMMQYLKEMARYGWHLDSAATSAANQVASGVMCFTLGTRSCLIWVTPGKEGSATNVTISSH
jgi:hypothetical protein